MDVKIIGAGRCPVREVSEILSSATSPRSVCDSFDLPIRPARRPRGATCPGQGEFAVTARRSCALPQRPQSTTSFTGVGALTDAPGSDPGALHSGEGCE
jgi:hypothetical protein